MLKEIVRSFKKNKKIDMVNPLNGLIALQEAIDDGFQVDTCDIYSDVFTVYDTPQKNIPRITYVKIESGKIVTYSVFLTVEPINGIPCFSLGYATLEKHRGKGLACEIIKKGINELKNGLSRNNVHEFYVEAIISVENHSSQHIARKLVSKKFKKIIDSHSGQSAYYYTRLIKKTSDNLEYIVNNTPTKNIIDPKSREYFDIRLFSIMTYASKLADNEILSLIFYNITHKVGHRYQCKGKAAIEEGEEFVNKFITVCMQQTLSADEKNIKLYASMIISGKAKNADLSGLRKYAEQNLVEGEDGVTQEGIDELNTFVFEQLEKYKKFPSESEFLGR